MSDPRWSENAAAVASAVRRFSGAVTIYPRLATAADRHLAEMPFLHAMLAGQTSLEAALLRILELFGEHPPPGRAGMRTWSRA